MVSCILRIMVSMKKREDLSAVQSLNANLQKELDRLYETGELSEDTMDELVKMHLRTPYSPMPDHDEEIRADKPASRLKGIVPISQESVSLSDMEDAIQNVEWRNGIT